MKNEMELCGKRERDIASQNHNESLFKFTNSITKLEANPLIDKRTINALCLVPADSS